MQVGTMSGTFQRPTLEESLDASLEQDIRHLQFNWGSAHPSGPLPEVIGEIEFRRRSHLSADRTAGKVFRRLDPCILSHHEGLAVVVGYAHKIEAKLRIARHGPCRVARENVDLPGSDPIQILNKLIRRSCIVAIEAENSSRWQLSF